MLRSRVGPAVAALAIVGGGIFWQTAGGTQQPRSRAVEGEGKSDVSGSMQGLAGTGGAAARDKDDVESLKQHDPKDTRLYSKSQTADSKQSAAKTQD